MKIEAKAAISIVTTKNKKYYYHRKGYYINGNYIKPKKILKIKKVPVKNPRLYGSIELFVDDLLDVSSIYMDENRVQYLCVSKENVTSPKSKLLNICTDLGSFYKTPNQLVKIGSMYAEGSIK